MRNAFSEEWEGRLHALAQDEAARARWLDAAAKGEADIAGPIVGEGIGLIDQVRPAAEILEEIATQAEGLLAGGWRRT